MSERVDKTWQSKGLDKYSTGAILGTLGHYGVELDEDGFRELARGRYPLSIAEGWLKGWKGLGQFTGFPFAAADELWRRLVADRLAPAELAVAVVKLVTALEDMRQGSPEAPVGERFKQVEELRARLPRAGDRPDGAFMEEVLVHLGDWVETIGHLAEALARDGHVDDAEDFAAVEELLFPERAGTARLLVRAAKGEAEAATTELEALAGGAAEPGVRLSAIDALLHLGADQQAKAHASSLLDDAERREDFHFAFEVAERLGALGRKTGRDDELMALATRLARLHELHDQKHQH